MRHLTLPALTLAIAVSGTSLSSETPPAELYKVDAGWLAELYSDKTWNWDDGHIYFAPGGTFEAAAAPAQSGEGAWYATKDGKICFNGRWSSEGASRPAKKCWKHARDRQNRLWQAPMNGWFKMKWSLFDYEEELVPGNINQSKFEFASGKKQVKQFRRLDDQALIELFYANTWKWNDGYAYFANRGVLTAVADPNSIGEGRWYPDGDGKLCIEATWTGPAYKSKKKTECWIHAKDSDGTIFQTPSDNLTEWSRFDPRTNLVKGDRYKERFTKSKRALGL